MAVEVCSLSFRSTDKIMMMDVFNLKEKLNNFCSETIMGKVKV